MSLGLSGRFPEKLTRRVRLLGSEIIIREDSWVQHLGRGIRRGEEEAGSQKGLNLPQEALKLRGPHGIVPSCGAKSGLLYSSMDQALEVVCPQEGA